MLDLTFGTIFWLSVALSIVYGPWVELRRLRGENAILRDKVHALMTRVFELVDDPPKS